MMQHDLPDDFVLATGTARSIEDFLTAAFARIGVEDWRPYVSFDPAQTRAAEVDNLFGDSSKAQQVLGWRREVDFDGLVTRMVAHDLDQQRTLNGLASPLPPEAHPPHPVQT
jgi:GDPmannose 4,6-dehydratase